MKVIDIEKPRPSVDELIGMAKDELVVLRRSDGAVLALSRVDDFAVEVELLRNNPEFMACVRQLSEEPGTVSLQDLRKDLGL